MNTITDRLVLQHPGAVPYLGHLSAVFSQGRDMISFLSLRKLKHAAREDSQENLQITSKIECDSKLLILCSCHN